MRTACCDWPAVARVSKLGTRHFAHRPGADCQASDGETVHHLQLKTLLVQALAARGWDASTEVAEDSWRADVLATNGPERVAFEVQWSAQDEGETVARSMRYAASGVRVVWLMRRSLGKLAARADIPCFAVSQLEDGYGLALGGKVLKMADLVDAYLDGTTQPAPAQVLAQQVMRAFAVNAECAVCDDGDVTLLGFVELGVSAKCGQRVGADAWFMRDVIEAASGAVRFALASGDLVLDGVRAGGGQRGIYWRSFCRSCGVIAARASPRSFAAAFRAPGSNPREVFVFEHRVSHVELSERHWCSTVNGCAEGLAVRPEGTAQAAQVLAAAAALGIASEQVPRPATLAGTSAITVIRLPGLRYAVICQNKPREAEMRMQRARLRNHGYQAVWVRRDSWEEDWEPLDTRSDLPTLHLPDAAPPTAGPSAAHALLQRLQAGGAVSAGRLRHAKKQLANVHTWVDDCWKCRRKYTAIGIEGAWRSRCGQLMSQMELSDDGVGRGIADCVRDGALTLPGLRTPLAKVERRFSNTEGESYWANVCPGCSALQGRFFHRRVMSELMMDEAEPQVTVELSVADDADSENVGDVGSNPHSCIGFPSCSE